mmetsp:Transcript_11119/g.16833  ORF Transcript_11119/g.16833 Transcript_11119/m.16833 type:complete len:233 (+) Transcript_11119:2904-3602(+)
MSDTSEEDKVVTKSQESGLPNDDPDVKVILLGDSAVGKSKLVERYLENVYTARQFSTYALTLFRKDVSLGDGTTVKVDFWDTAGQERFNSMHPSYYYQAHVCIMVFDVTRKPTYLHLKNWYKELREYCPEIPCILVANKVDVDYMVTKKNFKFPGEHNLPFFFASSADGTNVVKLFEEAICAALGHKKFGGQDFISECLELFEDEGPCTSSLFLTDTETNKDSSTTDESSPT